MAGSRRQWGWHELDPDWARHLVADARVGPTDLVLDVGAGKGTITAALVGEGARVVAIELHEARVRALRDRFGTSVRVVRADAADLRLPRRPFVVVSNPPFATASALLRRLLSPGSRLKSARLVLQRGVAARWSSPAAPGWNRWARHFEARPGNAIPRRAFRPPPRVDAQVLRIDRRL